MTCSDCGTDRPVFRSTCPTTGDGHSTARRDWRDDYARRLSRGTPGRGWHYQA